MTDNSGTVITEEDFHTAYGEDAYYEYGWKAQLVVYLMKVAGILSLFAAAGVAMETAFDHLRGKGTAINRTQFFFQIPISMFALVHFVGAWAAPRGTPGWYSSGTVASCEAMGFLKQFSLTLLPLDMWITTCHILIVKYGWPERRLRAWEKWVHAVTWPLGLVAAVFPLVHGNLNLAYDLCGMSSVPYSCEKDEDDVECLRGNSNPSVGHIIISVANIVSVVYAMFAMASIYLHVRHLENRNGRYAGNNAASSSSSTLAHGQLSSASSSFLSSSFRSGQSSSSSSSSSPQQQRPPQPPQPQPTTSSNSVSTVSRTRSRAVATQGMLYSAATFAAFFPSALEMLMWFIGGYEAYWIYTLHRFCAPLIGFLNMAVFFRNRQRMHTRYGLLLQRATWALGSFLRFCCCHGKPCDYLCLLCCCRRPPLPKEGGDGGQRRHPTHPPVQEQPLSSSSFSMSTRDVPRRLRTVPEDSSDSDPVPPEDEEAPPPAAAPSQDSSAGEDADSDPAPASGVPQPADAGTPSLGDGSRTGSDIEGGTCSAVEEEKEEVVVAAAEP